MLLASKRIFNCTDKHVHYTGALPLDFVIKRANFIYSNSRISEHNPFSKEFFKELDSAHVYGEKYQIAKLRRILKNFFIKEPSENWKDFFSIYTFLQSITKPLDDNEAKIVYEEGSYAISKKFFAEGVRKFEILAGPLLDHKETLERVLSMIQGFEKSEKHFVSSNFLIRLRLTFIRNEDGTFKNMTENSLIELFKLLEKYPLMSKRVSGFDFSGHENPTADDIVFNFIEEISSFNTNRKKKRKRTFDISVHAGENILTYKPVDYLGFFTRLLKHHIDYIGHGVFLWIPSKLIGLDRNEFREREELLMQFSKKNCIIEICPTANTKLTPIQHYSKIPLNHLDKIGINYSINTDNPTIFCTSLINEYYNICDVY